MVSRNKSGTEIYTVPLLLWIRGIIYKMSASYPNKRGSYIVVNKDGKIIDTFRIKSVARNFVKKNNLSSLGEKYYLEEADG